MKTAYEGERKKRMLTIAAAGLILGGFMWFVFGMTGSKTDNRPVSTSNIAVVNKEQTLEEGFRAKFGKDMMSLQDTNRAIAKNLEDLQKQTQSLAKENEKLKGDLKTTNDLLAAEMQLPAPSYNNGNGAGGTVDPVTGNIIPPAPGAAGGNGAGGVQPAPPVVTVLSNLISVGQPIGVAAAEEEAREAAKKKAEKALKIPGGSFVKGSLLSGVIAPTMGKGTADPVPALIRLTGISQLPNFAKADISGCFVLVETKGNLATETVSFRLKSLSCIKSDGNVVEKPVSGYVTGENGMEGLPGRVVSKQGALLARAFAAEFMGGMSKAFEEAGKNIQTTATGVVTTMDPDKALQTGLFAGAAGALSRVSEFYMDLADNMVPVIEINAGRNLDVVFTAPIEFEADKEG